MTDANYTGDEAVSALRREIDYRFEAIAAKFTAQEAATHAAYAAAKEAVAKAENANDKRFDLVANKIDTLTASMDKIAGAKQGQVAMMGVATFIISIVVFLVNYGFSK